MQNKIILGLLLVVTSVITYVLNNHSYHINYAIRYAEYLSDKRINGTNWQARSIESEIFKEYAAKKLDTLRIGLDKKSNEVLDFALSTMMYQRYFRFDTCTRFKVNHPAYHYEQYLKRWDNEISDVKSKYKLPDYYMFLPEVFFFHHGLRFADKRILAYIRNKDIIDCGAYIGDSLLVLKDYTDKTVYCYEFSPKHVQEFKNTVKNNQVKNYKLVPLALGDTISQMTVSLSENITPCQGLLKGDDKTVDITTIDAEAAKEKFTVGFLKMDVEGYGMPVIKGAINTIKRDRPVLALGIYHNTEELFGIKPYLEANLENYVYEFKLQNFFGNDFTEMILFAYPKEILEDNF